MQIVCCDYNLVTEDVIYKIFSLSHEVMTKLIPTTLTIYDEYNLWRSYDKNRINTKYIMLFEDDIIKGFLAYRIGEDDISLDDLIISQIYQNDGRTVAILTYTFYNEIKSLKQNIIRVYTNKANQRMQKLLNRIDFILDCKTERGFKYYITKDNFYKQFNKIIEYIDQKINVNLFYL